MSRRSQALVSSLIVAVVGVIGVLGAACCEDCDGFYTEAWVRVETTTAVGTPVANVAVRAAAPRTTDAWADTTDADGRAILHLFATSLPDSVQVSAEPSPAFTTPAPVFVAVVAQDTAVVVFTLEPVAGMIGALAARSRAVGRTAR